MQVVGLRPTFEQLKGPKGLLCLLLVIYCVYTVNDAKTIQKVEIRQIDDLHVYTHELTEKSTSQNFETMLRRSDSLILSGILALRA